MVSTDPGHEGYLLIDEPFFQQGLIQSVVLPPVYAAQFDDQPVIFAATPVYDDQEVLRGVLAGKARLDTLEVIMRASAPAWARVVNLPGGRRLPHADLATHPTR